MAPCYSKHCSSGQTPDGIQTFPFPIGKPECPKWVEFIRKDPEIWTVTSAARLCILHFEESSFAKPESDKVRKKKKLIDGAIPTILNIEVNEKNVKKGVFSSTVPENAPKPNAPRPNVSRPNVLWPNAPRPNAPNINPNNLSELSMTMVWKTFCVYKNTWTDFVKFAKLSIYKAPDESDFIRFFETKRADRVCGVSLKCMYSHLNKCHKHLYKYGLKVSSKQKQHIYFFCTTCPTFLTFLLS